MKLNNYVKSTRRGREANRVERKAMSDPFLTDAIDGFDAVYANHTDKLAQLENRVAKLARKKRKVRPFPTEPDALAVAMFAEVAKVVEEDEIELAAAAEVAKVVAVEFSDTTSGQTTTPAETDKADVVAERRNINSDDNIRAAETSVAEPSGNEQDPAGKSGGGKRRIVLWVSIAAVFALCAAGTALWYFDLLPQNRHTNMVARLSLSESSAPEVSGPELSRETDADGGDVLFMDDLAITTAIPAEQTAEIDEKSKVQSEQEALKSTAKYTAPVIEDRMVVSEELSVNDNKISEVESLDARKTIAPATATEKQDTGLQALEEMMQGVISGGVVDAEISTDSVSHSMSAAQNETVAESEIQQQSDNIKPKDRIPVVVNAEFNNYFAANAKTFTDSDGNQITGKVIAEFRVNIQGIPSGVRIISSPRIDMGRELVKLLVSGPRWEPTNGQRIRVEVEYK